MLLRSVAITKAIFSPPSKKTRGTGRRRRKVERSASFSLTFAHSLFGATSNTMATHVEPGMPSLAQPIQRGGGRGGEVEASTRAERTGSQSSSHGETLTEAPKQDKDEEKAIKEEDNSPQPSGKEEEEEKDPFLVTLEGREHLNPHTWPVWYRWWLTAFAGVLVLNASESSPQSLFFFFTL